MHGSLVTSIAVGKSCGVAPGAKVYYYSTPMWEDTNQHYIKAIKHVMELNDNKLANIKAISISTGMFGRYPDDSEFQQVVCLAESKGVIVFTCNGTPINPAVPFVNVGIVRPLSINNREKPADFVIGAYTDRSTSTILTPGDYRTTAYYTGNKVFEFNVGGGRSSAPPWLAGLIAIGYQVNPHLSVDDIYKYLFESAWKMPYGTVANPEKFIEMCKSNKLH
jgi:hypothetical protein